MAGLASLKGAPWLERVETRAVVAALAAVGAEARFVGGTVRNALMGLPVTDIDLATPAEPERVMAAARAAGLTAIPTGLPHGTVTIVANHVPFEVTTLREDVETFGRHARVAFTADWAADARRRDFTMNALYCDGTGTVYDPIGGYGDLLARRVRFIGSARDRIREDYLRILRFFRFHAVYGVGPLDNEGLAASVRERHGLDHLSGERVRSELVRLLGAPRAVESLSLMAETGLLLAILGRVPRLNRLTALMAREAAAGRKPDPALRLAALAVVVREDAEALGGRLKLSNAEQATLMLAALPPVQGPELTTPNDRDATIYRLGGDAYSARALLTWAISDEGADDPGWLALIHRARTWVQPSLPVGGADVKALGLGEGPAIGRVLAAVEDWWIGAGFPPDGPELRAALARAVTGEKAGR